MTRANASPTTLELKLEAHRLIDVISRKSGATKLLFGLLPLLKMYANYKSNGRRSRALMSEPGNNELQLARTRRALNATLKLEPTWTPKVSEQLEAFLFGAWGVRLDSGRETFVWKEEHLRSFEF